VHSIVVDDGLSGCASCCFRLYRSPKYIRLRVSTSAVYSRDLHNMTRIYANHIGHGSSLVYDSYALVDERIMFYFSKYKTKPHFFVKNDVIDLALNDVIDLALNDPDPDPCRFLFPDPPFTITGRSFVRWI